MANYYVAAAGSDSTGTGTMANPWATVSHAVANSAANDTISINGGDTIADNVSIIASYRTFNSYGTGQGTLNGTTGIAFLSTNCGMTITNLIVTCNTAAVRTTPDVIRTNITDNATHNDGLTVTNCTITGGGSGIQPVVETNPSGQLNNITITGNTISFAAVAGVAAVNIAAAANTAFSNVNISNNVIHDITGSPEGTNAGDANGVQINGANAVVGPVIIENNLIYNCGYSLTGTNGGPYGIVLQDCDSVTIQGNVIHDIQYGTVGVDGGGLQIETGATNILCQYNYFYNNQGPAVSWDGNSAGTDTIRWNLFVNNLYAITTSNTGAIDFFSTTSAKNIYNNTVIQGSAANAWACMFIGGGTAANTNIYNNIFIAPAGNNAITVGSTLPGTCHIDYNYYQSGNSFLSIYNGTSHATLAAWKTASGEDAHSVTGGTTVFQQSAPIPAATPSTLNLAKGYQPLNTSLAAQAGADLNTLFSINPGTQDFLSYPLTVPYSMGCLAFSVPALTAYQAAVIANKPFVWHKLNETSGTIIHDTNFSIGRGTYTAPTFVNSLVPNDYVGGAVSFNGTTSVATTTVAQTGVGYPALAGPITLEMWINPLGATSGGGDAISGYAGSSGAYNEINVTGTGGVNIRGKFIDEVNGNVLQAATTNNGLNINGNNHVVCTFPTSTTMVVYINGVSQGTLTYTSSQAIATLKLTAFIEGGSLTAAWVEPGRLAHAVFYPTALTAAQVLALFQAGTQSPAPMAA
jgi:hypothetical protein